MVQFLTDSRVGKLCEQTPRKCIHILLSISQPFHNLSLVARKYYWSPNKSLVYIGADC